MYSKDELSTKSISELADIAKEIGLEISSKATQEDTIYAILDKQAEVEGSKNPLGTKRRRTRIAKKETDKVYTVNGKEGENFDVKKKKTTVEQPSLFKEEQPKNAVAEGQEQSADETTATPAPKKRGRKPKSETAAEE